MGMLMEEVQAQWKNSKTSNMEIRVSMEKIAETLNNLEENIEWGQTLFEKRFEAVGSQKSNPGRENFTKIISHNVSKEQRKHIVQCSKPLE